MFQIIALLTYLINFEGSRRFSSGKAAALWDFESLGAPIQGYPKLKGRHDSARIRSKGTLKNLLL